MSHRFFRASESVYDQARAALDAAFGYPNSFAQTCFSPSSQGVRDSAGKMLLAIRADFADNEPAASMLAQLLASGAVEEIDEATYRAAIQQPA